MSFYAITKYNAENIIISGYDNYTILRLPYLYSADFTKETNVLNKIIKDIYNGKVEVKKKEISSLIQVDSVAKAINDVILNNANGIYHCADLGTFDWHSLIMYVSNSLNINVKINDITKSNSSIKNTTLLSQNPFFGYSSWQYGVDKIIMEFKK